MTHDLVLYTPSQQSIIQKTRELAAETRATATILLGPVPVLVRLARRAGATTRSGIPLFRLCGVFIDKNLGRATGRAVL